MHRNVAIVMFIPLVSVFISRVLFVTTMEVNRCAIDNINVFLHLQKCHCRNTYVIAKEGRGQGVSQVVIVVCVWLENGRGCAYYGIVSPALFSQYRGIHPYTCICDWKLFHLSLLCLFLRGGDKNCV